MFIVKVAWDARHQQFRLQDPKMAHMFQDGDLNSTFDAGGATTRSQPAAR